MSSRRAGNFAQRNYFFGRETVTEVKTVALATEIAQVEGTKLLGTMQADKQYL